MKNLSDRVKIVLESYGGNSDAWPEADRSLTEQSIAKSEQFQALQGESQELDQAIFGLFSEQQCRVSESDIESLKKQVLNQLPSQQKPDNNLTDSVASGFFWQRFFVSDYPLPVLLGSIALMMTMALVMEKPSLTDASLSYAEYQTLILESYTETEDANLQDNELQILAFLEPALFDD